MNVLLTGGAGYIGAHAVIELLDAKYSVVVFDNFSTGEKFKEALRATFNNVPIPSTQPSLRRNDNNGSIIRKDNNKNNVAGMELQRAPTLQDQQMILEVEWE